MRCFSKIAGLVILLVGGLGCGPRVTEANQRQALNLARLAASMLMEGELPNALVEARRSVALDPSCVDCAVTLGTIYSARAEFDRAEEVLLGVLEREPNNAFAANTLASTYLNMGRPAEAETMARRASEDETYAGRHLAFYHLGVSFFDRQDYPQALEAFAAALRESPRMCLAHFKIGETFFRLRRFEDALEHLQQAVVEPEETPSPTSTQSSSEQRTCHEMPDAYHLLGLTLVNLDQGAVARDAFERCIELAGARSEIGGLCDAQLEPTEEQE